MNKFLLIFLLQSTTVLFCSEVNSPKIMPTAAQLQTANANLKRTRLPETETLAETIAQWKKPSTPENKIYFFHPCDFNEPQTQQFEKPSLYQRFDRLDKPIQDHITGYLRKTIPIKNPQTGKMNYVDDEAWKEKQKEFFHDYLEKYRPSDKESAFIQETLREEYWDRHVKRARNQYPTIKYVQRKHNQKSIVKVRMVPSQLIDNPYYDLFNSLDKDYKNNDNHFEKSALMIACGALVKKSNFSYLTPLYYAIHNDSVPMVKLLNKAGLYKSEGINLPLHTAAKFNALEVIRYFHKRGHNLDAQDEDGKTPLHKAYFYEKPQAIQLLLSLGANPAIPDNNGNGYKRFTFSEWQRHLKKLEADL